MAVSRANEYKRTETGYDNKINIDSIQSEYIYA